MDRVLGREGGGVSVVTSHKQEIQGTATLYLRERKLVGCWVSGCDSKECRAPSLATCDVIAQ